MNLSISVKLDLPIVINPIQIIIYKKSPKKEKCGCNTVNVQKRNWGINTIILPTCHAPAQARSAGIYHLDLKPDNSMYTCSDRPR
jgi:serine/threonine protein kinase